MAREVRHEATEPAVLDADDLGDDGKVFVCRCGLSDDPPLCDGSHRRTADESDGVVYRYDPGGAAGERRVVEGLEFAEE